MKLLESLEEGGSPENSLRPVDWVIRGRGAVVRLSPKIGRKQKAPWIRSEAGRLEPSGGD